MEKLISFLSMEGAAILAGILTIAAVQFKNMYVVLILNILSNASVALNFVVHPEGISGVYVCLLAVVQCLVLAFYNRKQAKPHISVLVIFMLGYIACSAYTIIESHNPLDLLSGLAAVCFCLSVIQTKNSIYRRWTAIGMVLWVSYDLYAASYVMSIVHFGILVSTVIGMIRHDGFLRMKKA